MSQARMLVHDQGLLRLSTRPGTRQMNRDRGRSRAAANSQERPGPCPRSGCEESYRTMPAFRRFPQQVRQRFHPTRFGQVLACNLPAWPAGSPAGSSSADNAISVRWLPAASAAFRQPSVPPVPGLCRSRSGRPGRRASLQGCSIWPLRRHPGVVLETVDPPN